MRIDRPRQIAFETLRAVQERDVYTNLLLPKEIDRHRLDERDAAFTTELTYGALRWKLQNEAIAKLCVDRPWDQIDPELHDLLNLGVHQLHHMRVPSHAAVSATVDLAKAVVGQSRATFVNAVLRKVASQDLESWLSALRGEANWEEIELSHPRWIINAYRDALGDDESARDALAANNLPPRVTLVARATSREKLIEQGATPGRLSPFAAYWSGPLSTLDGMGTPALGVQDEGSQLVTLALTRVPLDSDHRWLDLCAGPGGKAALLSAIAGPDIRLVANESQDHRAALVEKVVGANTAVVVGDGRLIDQGEFDRVLIDAPCSGIGALRRRPEARWRRKPRDIATLVPLQKELLEAGINATRQGGVIAYVTCSPHIAETRGVVEEILSRRSDIEVIPAGPFLPEVKEAAVGPYVQLWPHRHGVDAMFMALLRRTSR